MRREYSQKITINGYIISTVIIDSHYQAKHPEITDTLILELVASLDGQRFTVDVQKDEYQYFKVEPVFKDYLPYRLVLVLCIRENFLGVINAFRVRRKKL